MTGRPHAFARTRRTPRARGTRLAARALAATIGTSLLAGLLGAVPATAHDGDGWPGDGDGPVLVDPGTLGVELPGSFVTATFNVLGHSHTAGADPRPSGPTRMRWTVELLRANAVDVVGLQELENRQARAFNRLAGDTYQLYVPGNDPRDSIAFRRDRFELVGKDSSVRIPYRQNVREMPVVILRDKLTGERTIVMSIHNVAGRGLKWQKRREISLRRELAAITRLRAATGLPVLFVGDFNDRTQPFYCRMATNQLASASVWWAAPLLGTSTGTVDPTDPTAPTGSTCELPRRAGIDWVFGTPDVQFLGYLKLDGGLVDMASDHPLVVSRVLR